MSSCPPIFIFLSYSNENIGSNPEEQFSPYVNDNVPVGAIDISLAFLTPYLSMSSVKFFQSVSSLLYSAICFCMKFDLTLIFY